MFSVFGLTIRLWLLGSAVWATLGAAFFWDDFMCRLGMGGNLRCGADAELPYERYILEVIVGVPLVVLVAGALSIWALDRGKRLR